MPRESWDEEIKEDKLPDNAVVVCAKKDGKIILNKILTLDLTLLDKDLFFSVFNSTIVEKLKQLL